MNAQNFTQKTLEMIQTAKSMAMENNNQYITPEHLLYALVDQDGGLIPSLLGKMGVDCNAVLSELDTKRQEFVLNRIGGGQTLITCCEDEGISRRTGGKVLHVGNGRIG